MLGVEFINEWFSNLLAAVLPAVKTALGLNYVQVSLLFTLLEGTDVISDAIFGVLGDIWSRRVLITSGTVAAGLGLLLMGTAPSYLLLLSGVVLYGLAGGPFVGLSQASLVDAYPGRHEHMMAWWTIIGDIGFLVTPLMVAAAYAFGIDWRPLFLVGGSLFIVYAFFLAGLRFPHLTTPAGEKESEGEGSIATSWTALKTAALDPALLRWAFILPLLEVPLNGFVVLYFHDVAGLSNVAASSTLLIVIISALVGRAILPWLLRYMAGIHLLKLSIWIGVMSFGAFLLVPALLGKFPTLALFSFVNASWYPLAQAQAYATQPGKSGVVLSVTSLISPITSFLPLLVGVVAMWTGLGWGLAVLLVGPVVAGCC